MVIYKTDTATEEDLYTHLLACSVNFVPPLHERTDINEYARKIAAKAVTFEAWDENVLIGLLAVYLNVAGGRTGFITNVSVVKEYAGSGIASILMKKLEVYALEKSTAAITLEVNKNNEGAVVFYKKMGFIQESLKDDNLQMRKIIAS